MQISVRHNPSFAVARLTMAVGEVAKAETGAMAAMSQGISVEASAEGGVFKALKRRVLSGESFFITSFVCSVEGGWVDVAPYLPGDVQVIEVESGHDVAVTSGCWLAHSSGLMMDSKWRGVRNLFAGEGAFVAKFSGDGAIVVSSYGAMDVHELKEGQGFTVDSGHLAAFDASVTIQPRAVAGIVNSVKSGEAIVVDVAGPGRVWTQTRNRSSLLGWLNDSLNFARK